ncbi:MAG: NAD(P)-dependent glycerol-3-phosphate dehydrogenase [Lentisphaerae bacterium]|nr:NAD(P)-dependent glycerol-3-phosphate dehydrogenase [Lentisphaerota bacterium]
MKIAILSDGGWGSALSGVLADNGHEVVMWGPFAEYLDEMRSSRENRKFLKGIKFRDSVTFESCMSEAVRDAALIVLATPTQYLRGVLSKLQLCYGASDNALLVNVAKGIEENSWLRISQMVADFLPEADYAVLSGPSHAEEVARCVPTAVVAAAKNEAHALLVQKAFMNKYFRVYTSDDVVSVELGGALKNVIAIAAGILDGMKLGDNPKAALMTRGIAEVGRLGEALGGSPVTFSGLSGIGDLIVTCCSGHSRNRHVGEELGRGKTLDVILKEMDMVVAEGVRTSIGAYTLARQAGVETPIIDEIYNVVHNNVGAIEALERLMNRSGKNEF